MQKNLTDEKLDGLMRSLITDASPAPEEVEDIVRSPEIPWAIRREIGAREAAQKSPWPPANILRRWLMIGGTAIAAAGLIISFMFHSTVPNQKAELAADASRGSGPLTPEVKGPDSSTLPEPTVDRHASKPIQAVKANRVTAYKSYAAKTPAPVIRSQPRTLTAPERQEIKTDFIALNYARDPASGQIVRVKVPSSMMVSLGVVSTVEKPAQLVDAEVLVGDDGLTRAIRFIRSN